MGYRAVGYKVGLDNDVPSGLALGLFPKGALKGLQLARREHHKERFQQDKRLSKAGIEVKVMLGHLFPKLVGMPRCGVREIASSGAEVLVQILDHFPEGADLI